MEQFKIEYTTGKKSKTVIIDEQTGDNVVYTVFGNEVHQKTSLKNFYIGRIAHYTQIVDAYDYMIEKVSLLQWNASQNNKMHLNGKFGRDTGNIECSYGFHVPKTDDDHWTCTIKMWNKQDTIVEVVHDNASLLTSLTDCQQTIIKQTEHYKRLIEFYEQLIEQI